MSFLHLLPDLYMFRELFFYTTQKLFRPFVELFISFFIKILFNKYFWPFRNCPPKVKRQNRNGRPKVGKKKNPIF